MVNRVTLIGHLGQDVELRYLPSNGTPVARINLATDASYKDKDGHKVEKTDWHRILVYQRMAENCAAYLGKGSLIYVEGSLSTRKWTDPQGVERYTTEVTARRIQFLNRKRDEQNQLPEELEGNPSPAGMDDVSF